MDSLHQLYTGDWYTSSILSKEEEQLLVDWINAYAKKRFTIKKRTLFETVKNITGADKRPNLFANSTPGKKWFKGFMQKNSLIAERYADAINTAKAAVSEPNISEWFRELHKYLEIEGCLDILLDSRRIFNRNESGFQTCPKTGKVLGPISFINLYEINTGNEKEAITMMATFNAAGGVIPGMIIYPLQKISCKIAQNVTDN